MKASHESNKLVGQGPALAPFLKAHTMGRLAHGWMFTGPKGVGKATAAHMLIRYLFAPKNIPFEKAIALETPTNHLLRGGHHPDVLVLNSDTKEKGTTLQIDDIRRIGSFVMNTRGEAPYKVVLIDTLDDVTPQAAQALLKNLEEPPAGVLFFLLTQNPHHVLPTLKSRCQILSLKPLSIHDFKGYFRADEISFYHALSEGCLGRALQFEQLQAQKQFGQFLDIIKGNDQVLWDMLNQEGFAEAAPLLHQIAIWWIQRLIKSLIQGQRPAFLHKQEQDVWAGFSDPSQIHLYLDLQQKIADNKQKQVDLNLDPKPILMNTFLNVRSLGTWTMTTTR